MNLFEIVMNGFQQDETTTEIISKLMLEQKDIFKLNNKEKTKNRVNSFFCNLVKKCTQHDWTAKRNERRMGSEIIF